jgi:hypothetical protein
VLTIKIIRTEKELVELHIKIPKRTLITETVYFYSANDIKNKIIEKLKEEKLEFHSFVTEVKALKNKLSNHLTEQEVKVKLVEKKIQKPKKTRKKKLKS